MPVAQRPEVSRGTDASVRRARDAPGGREAMLLTGARLGIYHVQERIGAGGMGEVYRARDTRLGRDVAIKILPAGLHRRS